MKLNERPLVKVLLSPFRNKPVWCQQWRLHSSLLCKDQQLRVCLPRWTRRATVLHQWVTPARVLLFFVCVFMFKALLSDPNQPQNSSNKNTIISNTQSPNFARALVSGYVPTVPAKATSSTPVANKVPSVPTETPHRGPALAKYVAKDSCRNNLYTSF